MCVFRALLKQLHCHSAFRKPKSDVANHPSWVPLTKGGQDLRCNCSGTHPSQLLRGLGGGILGSVAHPEDSPSNQSQSSTLLRSSLGPTPHPTRSAASFWGAPGFRAPAPFTLSNHHSTAPCQLPAPPPTPQPPTKRVCFCAPSQRPSDWGHTRV